MKVIRFFSVALCFFLLAGCQGKTNLPQPSEDLTQVTEQMLDGMREGNVSGIMDRLGTELTGQLSEEQLLAAWDGQVAALGAFQKAEEATVQSQDGQTTVSILCQHEKGSQLFVCTFDTEGWLIGIWLRNVSTPIENNQWNLPDGVTELDVVLGEGTEMELQGKLTLPMGDGPFPAVILVHGSGSTDMDETVGSNKPFRDLAYGLAERGIAVLRYDKSSYTHPEAFTGTEFTVDDEYTQTVKEAFALLQQEEAIGNIYLLGHSEGGMLAPYLMQQCGEFAGGILLAGTPLPLWDVIYRQNIAAIEELPESQKQDYLAQIEAEKERAEALDRGELEEDDSGTIFGIPIPYLRHMDQIDAAGLIKESQLPFLILQGEADFQVSYEVDFAAWKTALGADNPAISYRSYAGLNHLFMESKGEHQGTVLEYEEPGHIPQQVLDDIAVWIQTQE